MLANPICCPSAQRLQMRFDQLERRTFITLLGVAAAAWPRAAPAQQVGSVRRVSVLIGFAESDASVRSWLAAFRGALAKLGWTEGSNLRIELRWAGDDPDKMKTLAKELVDLRPDAILSVTTPVTSALVRETRTIPIVIVNVADPTRFITSLARPGGNVTGFAVDEPGMGGKRLELLRQIAPAVTRVALLFNPATTVPVKFYRGPGLIIMPDLFNTVNRDLIIALAAHYRVPAIYFFRSFADAGGLISYGGDFAEQYPKAAGYIDRILKGEKPADLPVQMPTKVALVINLKTAKALGLEVPPTLLAAADDVIE
jgi:putative ABC transport system substrate-binding protein